MEMYSYEMIIRATGEEDTWFSDTSCDWLFLRYWYSMNDLFCNV